MSKGEDTRSRIVERAASLFNQQGYTGASMADIMQATGLQKGGIYNHFKGKDELALEAFDYAFRVASERTAERLRTTRNAGERLVIMVQGFTERLDDMVVPGGCPVMNTAIECDDASDPVHLALRDRAQGAMDSWVDTIRRIVEKGIARGEIRQDVNGDELASLIIASLEGALMMSKLYDSDVHMQRVTDFLTQYIQENILSVGRK